MPLTLSVSQTSSHPAFLSSRDVPQRASSSTQSIPGLGTVCRAQYLVSLLLWYAVLRGAIVLLLLLHELGVIQLEMMWLHASAHRDLSTQRVKCSFLCLTDRLSSKSARAQGHVHGRGQFSQGSCVPKAELLSHLLKLPSRPACQIAPTATETRWSALFSPTPTELIQLHWEATPPVLSMRSNTSLLSLSFPV